MKFKNIYILLSLLWLIACNTSDSDQSTSNTSQQDELIAAAIRSVQDSMGFDDTTFERLSGIMAKYEAQTKDIQQQKFNNPKSKQQVMQNLMKSRRTELGDVLKPKEMMTFNKLYKSSLTNERKAARQENQLSEEDRKAMSQEIQAYRKASVAPIIIEQRKALEAAMSPTDKTQIEGLRQKMQSFNTSIKDKKATCEAFEQKDRKTKMDCRRELRSLQKTQEPIKKEIEGLISLLEEKPGTQTVMSTMNTQREQWRTDLKKILEKYADREIEADKIPLSKYFRTAPPTVFLMLDPSNINQSAADNIQETTESEE